jgi:hypothetical protein
VCAGSAILLAFGNVPNIHEDPAALKALQDDIYRERVLRARKMTVAERLADVFELSNHQFGMMLGGAMHRLGTRDEAAGWQEVKRWMERLDRVREFGHYASEKPAEQ